MATHSSVLAWRIPGTGEPGGLPSMGSHRVGHYWSDLAAAASYRATLFRPKWRGCVILGPQIRWLILYSAGILLYVILLPMCPTFIPPAGNILRNLASAPNIHYKSLILWTPLSNSYPEFNLVLPFFYIFSSGNGRSCWGREKKATHWPSPCWSDILSILHAFGEKKNRKSVFGFKILWKAGLHYLVKFFRLVFWK